VNKALFPPIPEETVTAARAIFGKSNFYLSVGDRTSELFSNLEICDLPNELKSSKLTLPMLYLLTIFQFMETLPDRRVADAIRERLDWKYGLHLPIYFPEVDYSALCSFRRWLLTNRTGMQNLQAVMQRFSELSFREGQVARQDGAEQIVKQICRISRTSEVWEAMSKALGALVTKYPEWLRFISLPHWYARYSSYRNHWEEIYEKPDWEQFVVGIGSDGSYLLDAVTKADKPSMTDLPEIIALKQVWRTQYEVVEGKLLWRKDSCVDCSIHRQI